jgi:hypothetical protein
MAELEEEKAREKATNKAQYKEWGVLVATGNFRPVHLANGIVQLLRLAQDPPAWKDDGAEVPSTYVPRTMELLRRHMVNLDLPDPVLGLCVTNSTAHGPLSLSRKEQDLEPKFLKTAREFFQSTLGRVPSIEEQGLLAKVFNADGKVIAAGGSDPTTPSLSLAGYTATHTLRGLHAATFLGLLCHTKKGAEALARLYELLATGGDSHSRLLARLKLGIDPVWPKNVTAAQLLGSYPIPEGPSWGALGTRAGEMASSLMSWTARGASKSETLMAFVDLASLLLTLRLLRWQPASEQVSPRLLLVVCAPRMVGDVRHVIERARESFRQACSQIDLAPEELINKSLDKKTKEVKTTYFPSRHAINLGTGGGWVYPPHSQGGARHYLRPGARQLATLVHSLVEPGSEMSWRDFAAGAQDLGLVFGGVNEHATATRLRIGAAVESVRIAGKLNQEHLVSLGLARSESDGVVIVDGGAA